MGTNTAGTAPPLTIAEAAEATGVSPDTLRWYERVGLVPAVARDGSGRRRYGADDLGWITFVRRLRATGMSTAELAEYRRMVDAGEGTVAERRARLERHREEVRQAIAELTDALALLDRKIADYAGAERHDEVEAVEVDLDAAARMG